eukprot:m.287590 g.287590  ORF g.287590 m.287590 type:complete len:321 (+) comp16362_c1_seq26:1318-2280(+)
MKQQQQHKFTTYNNNNSTTMSDAGSGHYEGEDEKSHLLPSHEGTVNGNVVVATDAGAGQGPPSYVNPPVNPPQQSFAAPQQTYNQGYQPQQQVYQQGQPVVFQDNYGHTVHAPTIPRQQFNADMSTINLDPQGELSISGHQGYHFFGSHYVTLRQSRDGKNQLVKTENITMCCCTYAKGYETQLLRDISAAQVYYSFSMMWLFSMITSALVAFSLFITFGVVESEFEDDDYYVGDPVGGLWALPVFFLLYSFFSAFMVYVSRCVCLGFFVENATNGKSFFWFFKSPALAFYIRTNRFDECSTFADLVVDRARLERERLNA